MLESNNDPNLSAEDNSGKLNSESEISTEKLLELSDDELKTKYGIDDPRNWKSYQRALHKEQRERADERAKFQKMLENRENEFKSEFQKQRELLESLKPKPKEDLLEPPQKPRVAFVDDIEAWNNYYEAKSDYDRKLSAKLSQDLTAKLREIEEKLTAKDKEAEAMRNLEAVKSYSKSIWMQEGLTAEEAEECWNFQASAKGEDKLKALAKMFKITKGNGSNVKDIMDERRKNKMDGAVPGAGAGSGALDTINPNEFTKTIDRNSMYKKQT